MFDFIYFETKKLGFAKRENCLDGVPVLLVLKHNPYSGRSSPHRISRYYRRAFSPHYYLHRDCYPRE